MERKTPQTLMKCLWKYKMKILMKDIYLRSVLNTLKNYHTMISQFLLIFTIFNLYDDKENYVVVRRTLKQALNRGLL